MNPDFRIIGVGSPIVDAIAQVHHDFLGKIEGEKGGMVLVEDETIEQIASQLAAAPVSVPGGSSGNTLFALARLGQPASFLGKLGSCAYGEFYRAQFRALGGDDSRFKVGTLPNGRCLSLVTPDGERTMRTHLGAAMTLCPDEISTADFQGCQHAHIEGYLLFNEALMRRVLRSAKEAGCSISLDLASFEVVNAAKAILPELLRDYVDIVFANEEEADAFTAKGDDYEAMARALLEFCDTVAVKVGAAGSYIGTRDGITRIPPVPAARLVDTTAAGDLWAAGFLYGWANNMTIPEIGRLASRLGSACVQVQGSTLPDATWGEILKSLKPGPTESIH